MMNETNFVGISIAEFLSIVKTHIRLLLIVTCTIISLSLGYAIIRTPEFTVNTVIEIKPLLTSNYEIHDIENPEMVLNALKAMDFSAFAESNDSDLHYDFAEEKSVKTLISKLKVSKATGKNRYVLSYKHSNPDFAKAFLVSIVNSNSMEYIKRLENEYKLVSKKLEEAVINQAISENSYKELDSDIALVDVFGNISSYENIIVFLNSRIRDIASSVIQLEQTSLLRLLGLEDPVMSKLVEEYCESSKELLNYEITQMLKIGNNSGYMNNDLSAFYRDNLDERKKKLLEQIALGHKNNNVESVLLQITSTVDFSHLITKRQYYLERLNENITLVVKQVEIKNEVALQRDKVKGYYNQRKTLEELRLENQKLISIVEPPYLEGNEGNRKTFLIIIVGIGLGIITSLITILIYDYMSDSISSDSFVKAILGNRVSFLYTILQKRSRRKIDSKKSRDLYLPEDSASRTYNQVSGIIQLKQNPTRNLIYSFSSLGYGEKSIVSVLNVALFLSKTGKKVLILGTNNTEINYQEIYSKIITSYTFVKNINHENPQSDSIVNIDSSLPTLHLDFLNLKPQELSVFLNSEGLKSHLESMSQSYDIILIDGPTFQTPADLLAVANITDGLILNIQRGIASKSALQSFVKAASFTQIPVLGVLFLDSGMGIVGLD